MEYNTFFKARDIIENIHQLVEITNKIGEGERFYYADEIHNMFSHLHMYNRELYTKSMLFLKEEINKEVEKQSEELKSL